MSSLKYGRLGKDLKVRRHPEVKGTEKKWPDLWKYKIVVYDQKNRWNQQRF